MQKIEYKEEEEDANPSYLNLLALLRPEFIILKKYMKCLHFITCRSFRAFKMYLFVFAVFLGFSIPVHSNAKLCIFLKCNLLNQGYILTHLYTQNYFRFPATLPNDSYFIGSVFAGASLKICAGLLHRLWPVINKNSPTGRAHRCYLGWPIEPQPGN